MSITWESKDFSILLFQADLVDYGIQQPYGEGEYVRNVFHILANRKGCQCPGSNEVLVSSRPSFHFSDARKTPPFPQPQ